MKWMVSEKVKFKDGWPVIREDSREGGQGHDLGMFCTIPIN